MRVGVAGLGYWGPNLVRNLVALDACTGVSICDIDDARVKHVLRAQPACEVARSYDELLADDGVEAVCLATPVPTHVDMARAAIRAGKSVLVEKPLAMCGADARALVREAADAGCLVMAGHTFLYSPAVRAITDLVQRGEIGRPLYVQSSRINLGIHQSDVSVLWDLAPHDLSIVLDWVGELPVRVAAMGRSSVRGAPLDVAFVDLEFPSGFVANLHLSWLAPTKVRRMTLVGDRKMVVYEDTSLEAPVQVFDTGVADPDPEDFGTYKLTYRTGDVTSLRIPAVEPLRVELECFLRRVADGDLPGPGEDAACAVVEVVEAAERSVGLRGLPVDLSW